jgi:hypothetical protein
MTGQSTEDGNRTNFWNDMYVKHQAMGNVQRTNDILVFFYQVMARPLPSVLGATARFEVWSPLELYLLIKTRCKTPWMEVRQLQNLRSFFFAIVLFYPWSLFWDYLKSLSKQAVENLWGRSEYQKT